ncbi:class II histone deacetylase [Rhodotorula paludigena]|uniref:class II histone deacetylase n=1 Tax=Rhodotorula paludigena TaxID=86838 RepID=UPI003174B599
MRSTGYIWDASFGWWDTGASPLMPSDHRLGIATHPHHVAHPDTKRRAHELIEVTGLLDHLQRLRIVPAQEEDVLRVHEAHYVERVKRESDLNGGDCGDTVSPFGRGAFDLAMKGAGAAITMLRAVLDGSIKNGYALIHPPGHHAEPAGGRGFCMFNNGAVCAEYAVKKLGFKKVAIVDLDVHHGNGAEKIFWSRSDVLTISVHQDRCFPTDSGFAEARGVGNGLGYNLNIPLPPGSGNGAYDYTLKTIVTPALLAYRPEVIIVASGLDPNIMDPLARQCVTADGFVSITKQMMDVAHQLGHDRLVYLQEGGYSPVYVPICVHRIIETLAGVTTLKDDPYEHILCPQHGSNLESWQKDAVDSLTSHLDALSPKNHRSPRL